MTTPSIWLWNLLLKIKWVCDVAKRKSFLSSFLVMFRLGLWLKMRFIAISMVSWSGIFVKRLVTSKETRHFLERFVFLIWETKEEYLCKSNHFALKVKGDHKETGYDYNIIKSTCTWKNWTKFRKRITRRKFVHFKSTIDTSRSRTRRIQFIIFIFIKKVFLFQLT